MNIKSGTKDGKPIMDFLFGGNDSKDTSLNFITMMSTVGVMLGSIIVGIITYMVGATDMVILHVIVNALLISGIITLGVAGIGLFTNGEWNDTYGFGMWLRIVIWGLVVVPLAFTINKYQLDEEIREKVNSFQFVRSDVKDCEAKIRMKSKSFTYDYCSSYSSDYNAILQNKNISAVLTGGIQYGEPKANHVEFIEKSIGVDFE